MKEDLVGNAHDENFHETILNQQKQNLKQPVKPNNLSGDK